MESAPAGWQRFIMKSKFGAGRDFEVLDGDEQRRYFVDGHVGPTPKADIVGPDGTIIYNVVGRLLGIPRQMTITDAAGAQVASMKAKMFSPIKSKIDMVMAVGAHWHIEGSLIEKDYSVSADGAPIMKISQKWVTIRDAYSLDVVDGVDPGLALAVVWAIDRWVERD
jgi:uncharacterized protein YxjI